MARDLAGSPLLPGECPHCQTIPGWPGAVASRRTRTARQRSATPN